MFKYIQNWSYRKKLQTKKEQHHSLQSIPLSSDLSIGILLEVASKRELLHLDKLKDSYRNRGITIRSLCYVAESTDVNHVDQKAFSKKHVGWDGIPDHPFVDEFMGWKFDILLCPILKTKNCISYILELSAAELKIGCRSKVSKDLYDIMIDVGPKKDINDILDELFKQIKNISD